MTNQDILEMLSELEAALYYRKDGSDSPEGVTEGDLETMHNLINTALLKWHAATGCTLN